LGHGECFCEKISTVEYGHAEWEVCVCVCVCVCVENNLGVYSGLLL